MERVEIAGAVAGRDHGTGRKVQLYTSVLVGSVVGDALAWMPRVDDRCVPAQ